MVSEGKLANAVGGKTARACDSCIRRRARWYCASDDAFLCQGCDASVHSANPLARRHERVLLKTASSKPSKEASLEASLPPWHHGFIKKARTPRQNKLHKAKFEEITRNPLHLVPEFCNDETTYEESEEQLLYRVPVFDPFIAELCTSSNSNEAVNTINNELEIITDAAENDESKSMLLLNDHCSSHDMNHHQLHGSLPSEMDLAQFAADVESLLGTGLDDESFNMEALGLMDCQEHDLMSDGKVKVEDDEEEAKIVMAHQESDIVDIDVTREPFELNFDDNSLITCEEHVKTQGSEEDVVKNNGKRVLLGLDYDGVITSWAEQRCPWTNGERPEFDSYECWPYCMGTCGKVHDQYYGDVPIMGQHPPTMVDEGREARVSRYREKRRTRLFSKKIRYEVRKLNAEKRPRMKGRFVKRANFAAAAAAAFP